MEGNNIVQLLSWIMQVYDIVAIYSMIMFIEAVDLEDGSWFIG